MQAASVFVLYATSQANTVATNHSRKTIMGPDVISAMEEMEFDKFVRPLENSLAIWKKSQQDKKAEAAKKKAAKKNDSSSSSATPTKETEVIEID